MTGLGVVSLSTSEKQLLRIGPNGGRALGREDTGVDFVAIVDQVITLLRQRGLLTYRTLQRQFQLDDAALDDLKNELIYGQRLAVMRRAGSSSGPV